MAGEPFPEAILRMCEEVEAAVKASFGPYGRLTRVSAAFPSNQPITPQTKEEKFSPWIKCGGQVLSPELCSAASGAGPRRGGGGGGGGRAGSGRGGGGGGRTSMRPPPPPPPAAKIPQGLCPKAPPPYPTDPHHIAADP